MSNETAGIRGGVRDPARGDRMAVSGEKIGPVVLATPETAAAFLGALDLSGLPHDGVAAAASMIPPFHAMLNPIPRKVAAPASPPAAGGNGLDVKSGVEQAWLVGSQIVSFDEQVTAERRKAALLSTLLAQLVATKKFPFHDDPASARAWHATYVSTLTSVGWVLQGGEVANNTAGDHSASVEKVVLNVIAAVLPGGAAAAIVGKVLDALQKLNDTDPLITLYSSRTVQQNSVDFAMTLGTSTAQGFLVSAIEYALDVKVAHNQALFFKWDATDASLSYRRFDLSLADEVYAAAAPAIAEKLKSFVQAYVAEIDL